MRLLFSLMIGIAFVSCGDKKHTPDVSAVKAELTVLRFDKEFFSMDTNNIISQTDVLIAKYPAFGENYLSTILGIDPKWSPDTTAFYLKGFLAYNKDVYDTAQKIFADFSSYQKQLEHALQFVKFYYPNYKTPKKIITYIGPTDGYGDILDDDAFIVGLHAHLGKDFPIYKTSIVESTYPEYVTANFTPEFIQINCLKNIVNDMYPEKNEDKRLIIQMIEKGKRIYLLSKFLPDVPENKLIGYTTQQMKFAYVNEAQIWNFFIENNYLQLSDNSVTKNYITDGPKTQELGDSSPGNIGSFSGWQIIKKYMAKNENVLPDSLMKMDAEMIYKKIKYKP